MQTLPKQQGFALRKGGELGELRRSTGMGGQVGVPCF